MEERPYQICARCVMDTTDVEITFDEYGFCNHCTEALLRIGDQLLPFPRREEALSKLVDTIKKEGKGKEYDCILGVSGGVDSTATAYYVKELGLRPLAIHFDNGWDSELAVDNIKNTLDVLHIDLLTWVVDWEEFRDLQLSFLRSSVANCEAPTDHGITALLFRNASRLGIRFILSGSNIVTEAIMPISWGHYNQDLRQLRAIHRKFGTVALKTMPTISISKYFYYILIKRIKSIPFLNYIDYHKENAKVILMQKLNWRDYGGKHYESVWTRFFQGYFLPTKFGFDKRKAHFSTMICSGQMTREHALEELKKTPYDPELLRQDLEYVIKKFNLTHDQFNAIMEAPAKKATEYPNHYFLFHEMRKYKNMFRKFATNA